MINQDEEYKYMEYVAKEALYLLCVYRDTLRTGLVELRKAAQTEDPAICKIAASKLCEKINECSMRSDDFLYIAFPNIRQDVKCASTKTQRNKQTKEQCEEILQRLEDLGSCFTNDFYMIDRAGNEWDATPIEDAVVFFASDVSLYLDELEEWLKKWRVGVS